MKKPPLKRMASGAWPVGSRNAFRWRVMAASDDVGQPQLAEQAALFLLGRLAALGERQEAFERQLQRLLAQNFGLERSADQRRPGAEHGDFHRLQVGVVEQLLLGRRALPPQAAALADGKLRAQFGFHQPGQGEIQVVAAQQQMLAHGGAGEIDQVAVARNADQAEVAGAAAHVADQHHLAVEELLARLRQVVGDPRIERRGGLFEQGELLEAGLARGLTVSSRASSSKDAGTVSTMSCSASGAAVRAVPLLAELADDARGNFHRRKHAPGLRRIPGQDLGGAVHIGVGEPRFGRMHQARGHQRALLARVDADRLPLFQKQKRRQRAPRLRCAPRPRVAASRRCGPAENRGPPPRVRRCRPARNWWCRGRCRSSSLLA